jgi:hypothetical protein
MPRGQSFIGHWHNLNVEGPGARLGAGGGVNVGLTAIVRTTGLRGSLTALGATVAAMIGFGLDGVFPADTPRRCNLPMTELRVNRFAPASWLRIAAICDADLPSRQSRRSASTCGGHLSI